MATGGRAKRGGGQGRRPAPRTPQPHRSRSQAPRAQKSSPRAQRSSPPAPATPPGPFRLGAVAGATPGKWIDIWHERMPQVELQLIPLPGDRQRTALTGDEVDAALVRLPIDKTGLHVISLYDEVPVVVCAADSHLTAADELHPADLAGEVVITPADDVLQVRVPDAVAPVFDAPATTEEAIATVATGVGVVIVPRSLARLHHRKDVAHRRLVDAPGSTVALAWPAAQPHPLADTFVGIVRGRTANSSRG